MKTEAKDRGCFGPNKKYIFVREHTRLSKMPRYVTVADQGTGEEALHGVLHGVLLGPYPV